MTWIILLYILYIICAACAFAYLSGVTKDMESKAEHNSTLSKVVSYALITLMSLLWFIVIPAFVLWALIEECYYRGRY